MAWKPKARRDERHIKERRQRYDKERGSARERGYTTTWDKARKVWLAKHPLCAECERQGETVEAKVVDHIVPHRGDRVLFWDAANWQSLCETCHNCKTARGE
jgi:5-methylcytosine-specific restriction enzyme A